MEEKHYLDIEKHWLETCIKEDKFITFEEAIKTFIPEFVLPKAWFVEVTDENQTVLSEWRGFKIPVGGIVGIAHNFNSSYSEYEQAHNNTYIPSGRSYSFEKEITFEQFKKYVLKKQDENISKFINDKTVINKEGEVFKVGDIIKSINSNLKDKIIDFRWKNDKSEICAVLPNIPNGIGIDKIELYIEPKVKITHNFKIGDKVSIIKKPVEFSQPHYLDKIFIVEKVENNRLIINNETNDLHISDKSVLTKNVKLVEPKQELSLLEQAKLKYPIGTKFINAYKGVDCGIQIIDDYPLKEANFVSHGKIGVYWRNEWLYFNDQWAEIVDDFVLPEKWCVKVNNSEERNIVEKYIYNEILFTNSKYFTKYSEFSEIGGHSIENFWKYPEITFEQFKKYVLKDE